MRVTVADEIDLLFLYSLLLWKASITSCSASFLLDNWGAFGGEDMVTSGMEMLTSQFMCHDGVGDNGTACGIGLGKLDDEHLMKQ